MRIYLVRHGQSQSNIDWTENQRTPDHAIELSKEGHRQAAQCGQFLRGYFDERRHQMGGAGIRLWQSPYTRTRQTADAIWDACKTRDGNILLDRRDCLHLHEQQFGIFDGLSDEEREIRYPAEQAYYEKCKKFEGKLWPKMPLGESRVDVALRVHQSFGTFHRDAAKHDINTIIVVGHGTTNRAFLMMWLHLPYEWMHTEPNPKNCSIRLIQYNQDKGYIFEGFPDHDAYKHATTKETEE